jgi:heme/copper-type cytochrome/quinol oxidase subunit 3
MNIPYTVEERPDTGLTNGKLGIWLFLASEVMLFGALFSSYVLLRVSAPVWPHGSRILNVPLATLNTVVLISSSVTMVKSAISMLASALNSVIPGFLLVWRSRNAMSCNARMRCSDSNTQDCPTSVARKR